jgi:hypothetical protein
VGIAIADYNVGKAKDNDTLWISYQKIVNRSVGDRVGIVVCLQGFFRRLHGNRSARVISAARTLP